MRSFLLGPVVLLAGHALAGGELAQQAGIAIGFPAPTPTEPPVVTPAALDRRAIDRQCFSSVLTELSPPTSGVDSKLLSWATNAAAGAATGCKVTAPASLSSAYTSYLDVLRTYFSTLESKASGIHTKCGADKFSVTFSQACTTSFTLLFTSGGVGNGTTATKTVAPVEVPKKTLYIGDGKSAAAQGSIPVLGSAVALAGVLAVALAL
ncbi:serglycin domain-containing protein [Purpureocillium lavendulum]|uniref:Serglycin domain-containing protein n=1 Tax=Purpureocillium lavendulum TaxID=1247861 RepID=A0AB34FSM0_9HYPO|nr:serglycin domain-containing protein [Purpureocillium lavendulum]